MNNNEWADGSGRSPGAYGDFYGKISAHGGLTDFGREVVREMNRIGMIVDVSHVSDSTLRDVLAVTTRPVIASHSCAYALNPHHRNLRDDLLQAIAANGGVVGVNFYPTYLAEAGEQISYTRIVDHIDHVVRVAGIDHVGLGSDFDGVEVLPTGMEDCTRMPAITEELIRRGYADGEILNLLGRNFLRVMAAVTGE